MFVYLSEKDLEHYVTGTTKGTDLYTTACVRKHACSYTLPIIQRTSDTSKHGISFDQFRKDGFEDIDLERQCGTETITMKGSLEPKNKKKTRLTLFN